MRSEKICTNISVEIPSIEYDFVAVRGRDDLDGVVAERADTEEVTSDDIFALEKASSWALGSDMTMSASVNPLVVPWSFSSSFFRNDAMASCDQAHQPLK